MRHALVLFVLTLALPALSLATPKEDGLHPCHSPMMEGGIRGPLLTAGDPAKYPEKARADKKEGMVVLEVLVRKDGTVGEVKTLRVSEKDYGFEQAAAAAVRKWTFRPALKSGTPVEVRCSLVLDFTLDEAEASRSRAKPSRDGSSPR
jgi:protein TonB